MPFWKKFLWQKQLFDAKQLFKEAFDKYNIYLFISNSIEDSKLNQYWKF